MGGFVDELSKVHSVFTLGPNYNIICVSQFTIGRAELPAVE
jgi:hypothetical protein